MSLTLEWLYEPYTLEWLHEPTLEWLLEWPSPQPS